MKKRLMALPLAFCLCFTLVLVKTGTVSVNSEYAETAASQSVVTEEITEIRANIYDCNMNKLVNCEEINQTKQINGKSVTAKSFSRYSENQTATHIIGYTVDGKGVCGIEYAFDEFLSENSYKITAKYCKDASASLTFGEITAESEGNKYAGVVTTLDSDIQSICEEAADKSIKKGAVIVMEPESGDIKAMVSRPNFSPFDIESALSDSKNSPLINRVLCSYNLGSIFKLVTASAALKQGIGEEYEFFCNGKIEVSGQIFKCHNLDGHGLMDMKSAIVHSCNPYFISLGLQVDSAKLLWYASALSYGRPITLCRGIASSPGNLQSVGDLTNIAEKANMVFGQGKLLATPLQVTSATCAFANKGRLPKARLIKGITNDAENIEEESETSFTRALDEDVADTVKGFMVAMIEDESNGKAKPTVTTAGAKTATAQTGRYAEDGHEIYNCWITGFFPCENPRYAVTVLIEGGEGSLRDCGPVFSEIADKIIQLNY